VSDNRVLRRILRPRTKKVEESQRRLHNEELHNLYSSLTAIMISNRELDWACRARGEMRNVHRILIGRPEGKRPLGRSRRGMEDNIKMDTVKTGCEVVDWIHLAQDRVQWRAIVNRLMNLRITKKGGNFLI
jgi:hypothetical protein